MFRQLFLYTFSFVLLRSLTGCESGASTKQPRPTAIVTRTADSLHTIALLEKGDSLYALRSGFGTIAESLVYFDSARRMALRLNDTFLLAYSLYYTGNVYNAWNKEPHTTLNYYQQAFTLFNTIPNRQVKAFQLRYIIAHALDGEKLGDSTRCVQTVQTALRDLEEVPDSLREQMNFLPDFAWVASNCGAYALAERMLAEVPRHRIFNDPATNNYLDHYYLTRSRIDVFKYNRKDSPYLDSLAFSLQHCTNRFDSSYYALNLSNLYAATGNSAAAYRYLRLNTDLQKELDNSTVLSRLQTELANQHLQAQMEQENRVRQELKNKNLYIVAMGLVLLVLGLMVFVYLQLKRRRDEKADGLRQQQFTYLLLQKEEEERRRIATDLHDGINHELLALKNRLLLRQPLEAEDVEAVIISVREVSRNLYPALFESIGLAASVEALCDRMTRAGFFTTCDLEYTPHLSKNEELQVYRIVQEALTNIAKHASAEAGKVTIYTGKDQLWVEIKDNGKGFNTNRKIENLSSFGLQSIQQRTKAIGGQLSLQSSAAGTTITLTKKIA